MPVMENCVKLYANTFREHHSRGRIEGGWTTVGYVLWPDKVNLVWARRAQVVRRVRLPLTCPNGGWVRWWLCPTCGRQTPTLYLPPGAIAFACRHCLKLTYGLWKRNGYYRWPKDAGLWLKQFMRRAGEVQRHAAGDGKGEAGGRCCD
ncbi:hypothetical protein [Thermanaeromonas sp. C210]|uniref:hypothetical protein n=1 Tax=Thermanaeromonas sp. C210 TaxID=2731925 RepID=UPI00155C39BF|nr:hypothetical protein [Thermanaeromonas sp. C210]GFN22171.1 hypothetical protein TAMC210_04870 [Thermanaeromonas sp. C210]